MSSCPQPRRHHLTAPAIAQVVGAPRATSQNSFRTRRRSGEGRAEGRRDGGRLAPGRRRPSAQWDAGPEAPPPGSAADSRAAPRLMRGPSGAWRSASEWATVQRSVQVGGAVHPRTGRGYLPELRAAASSSGLCLGWLNGGARVRLASCPRRCQSSATAMASTSILNSGLASAATPTSVLAGRCSPNRAVRASAIAGSNSGL